jgi:hypothetical protein
VRARPQASLALGRAPCHKIVCVLDDDDDDAEPENRDAKIRNSKIVNAMTESSVAYGTNLTAFIGYLLEHRSSSSLRS